MHPSETQVLRPSLVVERDWVADEWVVTAAQSDADGLVVATVVNRYPTALWSASDLADLVFGVLDHPIHR